MPDHIQSATSRKRNKRLLVYLAVIIALLMLTRCSLEHQFLYFPTARQETTPAKVGLSYEAVNFPAIDGAKLSGWLVPGDPGAPVVLFCIGNAGNISHRLETLQLLHDLGVATFIFNYRGYGESAGKASEKGTYHDVAGALGFLNQRGWSADRIILFGRSLGAAVGLESSLRTPTAGLIMESAFTSISAMGKHHYPLLHLALGWLIDAKYDNLAKIAQLQSPLLLIHGQQDTICPPHMAEQLYVKAPANKRIYWIPDADHNNGYVVGAAEYRQALQEIILQWTGYLKMTREDGPRRNPEKGQGPDR